MFSATRGHFTAEAATVRFATRERSVQQIGFGLAQKSQGFARCCLQTSAPSTTTARSSIRIRRAFLAFKAVPSRLSTVHAGPFFISETINLCYN